MPSNDSNGNNRPRPKRTGGTPSAAQPYVPSAPGSGDDIYASTEGTQPRPGRTGTKTERRAEWLVASLFLLGGIAAIGFMAAYVAFDVETLDDVAQSNLWLGLSMTVAFFAIGIGAVVWIRHLMPDEEVEQEREPLPSSMEEKREFMDYFLKGAEDSGITKRPLVRRTLLAALVPLGIAPVFLFGNLAGDAPFKGMRRTVWRNGLRLMKYGTGEPIRPEDFYKPGSILTVIPEGHEHDLNVLADATVQIIKFRPEEIKSPTRMEWVVDDIVAYSKICTHVGCATGLYEDTTHHILCPCHQSTFDASRGCKVVFGPAGHPLPQLPLGVDAEGYLVSTGDFPVPPGPSFWGRG